MLFNKIETVKLWYKKIIATVFKMKVGKGNKMNKNLSNICVKSFRVNIK